MLKEGNFSGHQMTYNFVEGNLVMDEECCIEIHCFGCSKILSSNEAMNYFPTYPMFEFVMVRSMELVIDNDI